MKERPIIFNSEMVRAILDGKKTQMRRPIDGIKDHYEAEVMPNKCQDGSFVFITEPEGNINLHCPYGKVGDTIPLFAALKTRKNKAGKGGFDYKLPFVVVKIADVRAERVQQMCALDVEKEGLYMGDVLFPTINPKYKAMTKMKKYWNSIYGQDAWDHDDWVWVVEFELLRKD